MRKKVAKKTRTTKAVAASGSLSGGRRPRVRRPDSNGMSDSPRRTPSPETERAAEQRLGISRKTLRLWKGKGFLALDKNGQWVKTSTRQLIEDEKLKQLQIRNEQALQQTRSATIRASKEVEKAFSSLVVTIRNVIENICFRVTADPTMQAKIYAHLREALDSESARLSKELGLSDGPTPT